MKITYYLINIKEQVTEGIKLEIIFRKYNAYLLCGIEYSAGIKPIYPRHDF